MKGGILLVWLFGCGCTGWGYGTLPDASQEGILKQYSSYDDIALFHYTVPQETTRATWEFASFQDSPSCPHREVMIWLQHGSYPLLSPDNSSFSPHVYTARTSLHSIRTYSAYQPHDSTVFPVYNPLPGTWFAAAYLSPFEEKIAQQGIHHRCRYSLGSVALWTVAEQVDLITPFQKQNYKTKKHYSYYKFFITENIDLFNLTLTNCQVNQKLRRTFNKNECIEYVRLRARALPRHDQDSGGHANISQGANVTFTEPRPFKSAYYYLLVVSSAEASFDMEVRYEECGGAGLYGHRQQAWYLSEEGLIYNASRSRTDPKEPKHGFQLLSLPDKLHGEEDVNYDLGDRTDEIENKTNVVCLSTFDFTRVDNVEEFSTSYLLQGKSWYTKWVTVSNRFPVLTRFQTLDFTDLGGTVNIVLAMDNINANNQTVEIYGCLSQGRHPLVVDRVLTCSPQEMISITSDNSSSRAAMKLIPFPEPSTWYLAFQARCLHPDTRELVTCWGDMRFASLMTSIDIHLQPCGYRAVGNICGPRGVCVRSTKGAYMYTSCKCSSGYRGWTCDDESDADPPWRLITDTLLLTLSNLFFLPAVILALYYRLYTEALIYGATMFFSTFYHTCDQEMSQKHLPLGLEKACRALYVSKEVLQFCDFFCAILSFWVTIISMAKLPEKLVSFLHMLGVLLISVLVQYNRNGIQVFAIPIPLGFFILLTTLVARSFRRRKILQANRRCLVWLIPGILCAITAVLIFALIETTSNYQYVHSSWHILIALSLVFLLPHCKERKTSHQITNTESLSSERSELHEVNSIKSIDTLSSRTHNQMESLEITQNQCESLETLSSRTQNGDESIGNLQNDYESMESVSSLCQKQPQPIEASRSQPESMEILSSRTNNDDGIFSSARTNNDDSIFSSSRTDNDDNNFSSNSNQSHLTKANKPFQRY